MAKIMKCLNEWLKFREFYDSARAAENHSREVGLGDEHKEGTETKMMEWVKAVSFMQLNCLCLHMV